MTNEWIKMRIDLSDDPAVISMAARLGLPEAHVVGLLHGLWGWADRHTRDGCAPGASKEWLDRRLGVEGFADALIEAGWLRATDEGLEVPEFERHMGASAKRRASAAERQKRLRERSNGVSRSKRDECHAPALRKALPEEEEEAEAEHQTGTPQPPKGGSRVVRFRLPDGWSDPDLTRALADWKDMRRRQRAPLTQLAADRALRKLEKLSAGDATTARAIVEQSVDSGWKGFFPLHGENGNGKAPPDKLAWMKAVDWEG